MDSSTTHREQAVPTGATKVAIAPEFGTWPVEGDALAKANTVREHFNHLLEVVTANVPKGNERYLALTKTKLEEACMFAVKAIAKPTTNN